MSELLFPLQFKRQYGGPLDPDVVFPTLASMNAYLSSPLRYPGMVVTCLQREGELFTLNAAGNAWMGVTGSGGGGDTLVDGGAASSVYLPTEVVDGGGADNG
jgi:hypothetical protein